MKTLSDVSDCRPQLLVRRKAIASGFYPKYSMFYGHSSVTSPRQVSSAH